jgi:hypothetical protein
VNAKVTLQFLFKRNFKVTVQFLRENELRKVTSNKNERKLGNSKEKLKGNLND